MKKIQIKHEIPSGPATGVEEIQVPYEIIYANPRDEEIHLNFLKRTQINAHMARWFLDYEYNQLIWSDGVFQILELDARKFGANCNSYLEAVHPDDRRIKNKAQADLKKTSKPIEINYRLLFNDGRIKWINEICSTDFDSEGHPIRSYGTIQDISKYKFTEDSFKKQEAQFKNLIESIPIGIAVVRGNQFVFVNLAGKDLLSGHSQSKLIGKNISDIIPPDLRNSFLKKIRSVARGNFVGSFESELKRLDNTVFDAEITLTKTLFRGSTAIQLIVNNVSGRVEAEKQLKENEIRLKELIATKDKFTSIIAHDLRSPLNSIIGFLRLLNDQYDDFNDTEKKNQLSLIEDNATKTVELLEDLLEWAKAQNGLISFNPDTHKLLPIANHIKEILDSGLKLKQQSMVFSFSPDLEVFADKNMLTTVLLNLSTNAVKYSYPGGVITIAAGIKNGMAEISVSDTGTGMGAEAINKLFTPEKKVSVPGTAYEKGSGLGLILCKDFIERHHGKIWVESDPGKGSSFIFRIPQKPD